MSETHNPFAYDAASNLDDQAVLAYYVDDHSFGRLLRSKRNVFLIGERGSGKTMTLLYNTLRIQLLRSEQRGEPPKLDLIGVLIPCNTPLTHRREDELLSDYHARLVSEHILALAIAFEIVSTLEVVEAVFQDHEAAIREEIEFVLGLELPNATLCRALKLAIQREVVQVQREINQQPEQGFFASARSFVSLVLPLISALQRAPALSGSHFMLMLDDAHDLNRHQIAALNSWIAYRDRTAFSFKVATAKVGRPGLTTGTGGTILEGHDFITIDLEGPYHNDESNFGKLARDIIAKRLKLIGVDISPEEFFPENPDFRRDLDTAEQVVMARAREVYPEGTPKQINDYVYKYRRPEYFRQRSRRANLPPYSGFQTLVYLSTGVARNLLEPCSWMYDDALSALEKQGGERVVRQISPRIQSERILDRSREAWRRMKELHISIEGCSFETGQRIYNLFDALGVFFKERLLHHPSEPGAISFAISQRTPEVVGELLPLLRIAQKAQLLYEREGSSKDDGKRETYYVPNRMLWPIRGLDPYGQHARASIKASELLAASYGNVIPPRVEAPAGEEVPQPSLFDV
jgi:hypothetical protein